MLRNSNFASKRISSHSENLPPSKLSRRFDPINPARRNRRTRANGHPGVIHSKYNLEQAHRRSLKKPVRFQVQCKTVPLAPASQDVSMADGTAKRTKQTIPVVLPRGLGQPPPTEVTQEALRAAFGVEYKADAPASFCRDVFKKIGLRLLDTVISVEAKLPNSTALPKELTVLVHDDTADNLPTHMLAVYAARRASTTPASKLEVKLYPIHGQLLASHCARLPNFAPSPITSIEQSPPPCNGQPRSVTLPVQNLCLPTPSTFPQLSQYLYTRRAEILYKAFLPVPPAEIAKALNIVDDSTVASSSNHPSAFFSNPIIPAHQVELAEHLSDVYTSHKLLEHVATVHGMWMNACALGIYDETLWAIIDGCWEVLLKALSLASGSVLED